MGRLLQSVGLLRSKFDLQILCTYLSRSLWVTCLIMYPVRLILAGCNAASLCAIRRPLQRRFGRTAGAFFTLLTCSQFHLMFWMGRTLPNMFALFPGVSL